MQETVINVNVTTETYVDIPGRSAMDIGPIRDVHVHADAEADAGALAHAHPHPCAHPYANRSLRGRVRGLLLAGGDGYGGVGRGGREREGGDNAEEASSRSCSDRSDA